MMRSVLCGLFLLALLTACTDQPSQETKVGALLPLTGEYASLGAEIQRGIELANDAAARPVQIIYEDVGSITPAKAITPASKLIHVDDVAVALVADSQNAVVLGPVFSENGVPLVVLWDSSNEIIGSGAHVYSTGFSSERSAEGMAEYAYNELHLRNVATVKQQDPYSVAVADAFTRRFTELGGNVVIAEETAVDEQDFRTVLSKIKASSAEGIYLPVTPQTEVSFVRQVKQMGLNTTLLAADWFFQDTIDAAGPAAEGVYLHTIYADDVENLTAAYRAKYGQDPADITVVSIGYVGMQTVHQALDAGQPIDEGLKDVTGDDRTLERKEKVYVVADGKAVLQN